MRLSENIKRLRLAKKLTQEQLAASLGVSAQAVSKWETSDTYPDGALLLPLAKELGVSLDELFDNDTASMADISKRVIRLIRHTATEERFHVARDIGWQIQRGLFGIPAELETKYDPDEIKNQQNHSYILNDSGFTIISNGKEPFFSVFPQPTEGFGDFLCEKEALQKIFAALSRTHTLDALIYLYHRTENYIFESTVLARDCKIPDGQIETVLSDLLMLRVIWRQEVAINGQKRTLYYSRPSHWLIALFLMAKEIQYRGAYALQSHGRTTPFFKE